MEGLNISKIFKDAHNAKGVGRHSIRLALLFDSLTNDQKNEFRAFTPEKQALLLCLPQKKLKRFKQEGVDGYVQLMKEHPQNGNRYIESFERNCEKRKQQIIAGGGSLVYNYKDYGNKQRPQKDIDPYNTSDPKLSFRDF